jgi:hypothetical protein
LFKGSQGGHETETDDEESTANARALSSNLHMPAREEIVTSNGRYQQDQEQNVERRFSLRQEVFEDHIQSLVLSTAVDPAENNGLGPLDPTLHRNLNQEEGMFNLASSSPFMGFDLEFSVYNELAHGSRGLLFGEYDDGWVNFLSSSTSYTSMLGHTHGHFGPMQPVLSMATTRIVVVNESELHDWRNSLRAEEDLGGGLVPLNLFVLFKLIDKIRRVGGRIWMCFKWT